MTYRGSLIFQKHLKKLIAEILLLQTKTIRTAQYESCYEQYFWIVPPKLLIRTPMEERQQNYAQLIEAKLPACSGDFKIMLTMATVFVDKTLLIRDIIDLKASMILINRPRRWGKTITLNMLCRFFSKIVDGKGRPLSPQPDRILFEGGAPKVRDQYRNEKNGLFGRLKIGQQGEKYMNHQGMYPVIYMTWHCGDCDTFFEAKARLAQNIREVFWKHAYLVLPEVSQINPEDKTKFLQWLQILNMLVKSLPEHQKQIESIPLQNALVFLSKTLNKFHKQKVVIFIDEYDTPFNRMLLNDIDRNQTNKAGFMYSQTLSAILEDRFDVVYKAVFIGVHNTLLQGLSVLTKAQVCRITDHNLAEHFGFSKEEIEEQLISKVLKFVKKDENGKPEEVRQVLLQRISEWYNGYKVPVVGGGYRQTYNPFPVINYLRDCVYRKQIIYGESYWTGTVSINLLKKLSELGIKSNKISMVLSLNTQKAAKMQLSQQYPLLSQLNLYNERDLTRFLVDAGYLTGQIIKNSSQQHIQAIIPNRVISQVFRHYCEIFSLSFINLANKNELVQKLQKTFEQCKKYFDNYSKAALSDIIAARLLSADKGSRQQYSTSIKRISGDGFMSSISEPLNEETPHAAIISEYKYTDKAQQAMKLYKQALWQIYEKDYIKYVLEQSGKNNLIEAIVTRPIIIIANQLQQSITIYTEQDIQHTIEEARKINACFSFILQKDQKQEKIQQELRRMGILSECQAKDLQQLLQKICKHPSELQASFKELMFSYQKNSNIWPLNYGKVLWNLPYIFQQFEWTQLRKRFISTFPDEQTLYRATIDEIFSAVQQNEKAQQIFTKLQQMKKDIKYYLIKMKKVKQLQNPIRQTNIQVMPIIIQRDPLQEAFSRIDSSTLQKLTKDQQETNKGEGQLHIQGQTSFDQAVVDQKLTIQARQSEINGLVFEPLDSALLEGIAELVREHLQLSHTIPVLETFSLGDNCLAEAKDKEEPKQ